MIDRVLSFIQTKQMLSPGDKVVLGVSGGPDSMALWEIMQEIAGFMRLELIIAHVNHGLRPEADEEEEYVRSLAKERKVKAFFYKVDVKERARQSKSSVETAARQERYAFFARVLEETGAARIATAHHRDDVAETVLLHLLRGSGIRGLRGIMPINNRIIRPLLILTKGEILDFLAQKKVKFFIDKSNNDPVYLRNRIRHELIPWLQAEYNPAIIESLNQLADIAREENEAMEKITGNLWKEALLEKNTEAITLKTDALKGMELAFKRRIILKALTEIGGYAGWNLLDVERVIAMLNQTGSRRIIKLRKGIRVNKVYDKIIFITQTPTQTSFFYVLESVPTVVRVGENNTAYSFELLDIRDFNPEPGTLYLDYAKLSLPLVVRNRLPGDHFYPQGMEGRKKLKDYFIDRKIPYFLRDKIPLLSSPSANRVWAILDEGRIDKAVAVNNSTRQILVIKKSNIVKNN